MSVMFSNISRIYFSILAYKTLGGIVTLFFSNCLQSPPSPSDGKIVTSHLYLFLKGLIFVIISGSFSITSRFYATITAY